MTAPTFVKRSRSHTNSIVVLAGWLGSQPKSLRRYEALYRSLGVPVVYTHIAPPFTIVQSVLESSPVEPIQLPQGWPKEQRKISRLQDLAWNILKDVHDETSCNSFYLHVFSNGGCFVWEQIRQILSLPLSNLHFNNKGKTDLIIDMPVLSVDVADILFKLRQQLAGVVFDSCPVADLHRLPDALRYCSFAERLNIIRHCGFDHMLIQSDPKIHDRVQNRIQSYVSGLVADPLQIPQLYVYGRDDPLAPASFIDELVQKRKESIGDPIMSCCWDESLHCGHLRMHPHEYSAAIESLLTYEQKDNICITQSSKIVKSRSLL